MKRILVTGGTVFVSRFVAQWYVEHGWEVYVLNRGTRAQAEGVHLICADRHGLGNRLKTLHFDVVIDVCAYDREDVDDLLDGLGSFDDYLLISSSAVYPETLPQPFCEDAPTGPNSIWGKYGTDKIAAEKALLARCPQAYVLRPPYLYGPGQNIYREPFVFDCALAERAFYVPGDGSMGLQFFHVRDLCRVMDAILHQHPEQHVINVGNEETVSISEFVRLCYHAAGISLRVIHVHEDIPQRLYFCFHDYDYVLDVSRQKQLIQDTVPLFDGLTESFEWYKEHKNEVIRRDYLQYIDTHLTKTTEV